MCIAVLARGAHPDWPLVVVANRDEFHDRPTAPLARWTDGTGIIAGRDLQSGGSWLGISERTGRVALITNFRDPDGPRADAPSRGQLVTDWLTEDWSGVDDRADELESYNGFSLMLVDGPNASILDNRSLDRPVSIDAPGFYGLSNGPFTAPWPKTERLVEGMRNAIAHGADADTLFDLLAQRGPLVPGDSHGAPIFIDNETYGTRCSTVIAVDTQGQGTITERRFDRTTAAIGETAFTFRWS